MSLFFTNNLNFHFGIFIPRTNNKKLLVGTQHLFSMLNYFLLHDLIIDMPDA